MQLLFLIKKIILGAKYKVIRLIEKNIFLQILIYNNISHFTFFFPHEKDYHGIKLIFKNQLVKNILDIGANIGLSTLGFNKLGFKKSNIHLFEPDKKIYEEYLLKLKRKIPNIKIYNYGLHDRNETKNLYKVKFKNTYLHFYSSLSKKFLVSRIKLNYGNFSNKFIVEKNIIKLIKYDSIKFNFAPDFIKIDVEGFEHKVLLGMKKTIQKYKPVFLIEYNPENFSKILRILKSYYYTYTYNINNNKLVKFKYQNSHSFREKNNYMTRPRNIFFINKIKCKNI